MRATDNVTATIKPISENFADVHKKDCIDSLALEQQLTKNPNGSLLLKTISNEKIGYIYIKEDRRFQKVVEQKI